MNLGYCYLMILSFLVNVAQAQTGSVMGTVKTKDENIAYATVYLEGTDFNTQSALNGHYSIEDIPFGAYKLVVTYVGYEKLEQDIHLTAAAPQLNIDLLLSVQNMNLETIVVTGTKTFKRQTDSPMIVNVVDSETLSGVQACNLAEGLKFQPGLRVETDCQTCNYTQLRMNGLSGNYSQILINGRQIFSPLTGLYGMEQIPANLIDRIEVIKGGGASLYGSSAVGGTVNIITKVPKKNSYELHYNYHTISGQSNDHQLLGNASLVSENKNAGVSFFLNKRQRDFYDHNDDNFSEIPLIENTALGATAFFLPQENQKLELSISNLNEYRLGGEMIREKPAYLTQQSEERDHRVWLANADYQINFNQNQSSLITYVAWQHTDRHHYTGILPDEETALTQHYENPPYGNSKVQTVNTGLQLNHRINQFLRGTNVLTFGAEYIYDKVFDEIPAYQFLVDQTTRNAGLFLQSDWELFRGFTLLSGARLDQHNLMENAVISPRASLLYKWKDYTQFRLGYGTGFRAPQAFDTDLHIAFAGGGVSRISLAPTLQPERSESWSASVNFDKPTAHYIAGFTLEGFYTRLKDAFILQPVGADDLGELFEKQNGAGATVQGLSLEMRANYDQKIQLEAGATVQKSTYQEPVSYIDGVAGMREFIRTPNQYGFAILTLTPSNAWSANLNYVYTGSMKVPHFAGAPNQEVDEIIESDEFHELSGKVSYTIVLPRVAQQIELYIGVKNIFNAYQSSFDIGKNRDSNFVYGPAQPRTFFIGIKLKG